MIEQQRQILETERRLAILGSADPAGTWLGFVIATAVQPFPAPGTVVFYGGLPRSSQTPRRFRCWCYVANTNDALNYWTITAQTASGTIIASVSTGGGAPIAPDAWAVIETTTMSVNPLVAATHGIVQIAITSTGAPGDLSLVPMLYVL